jgi:hypothetical protein
VTGARAKDIIAADRKVVEVKCFEPYGNEQRTLESHQTLDYQTLLY